MESSVLIEMQVLNYQAILSRFSKNKNLITTITNQRSTELINNQNSLIQLSRTKFVEILSNITDKQSRYFQLDLEINK